MASLDAYRGKRDFTTTAEPKGRIDRRRGHRYCIQKHDATRLHYDLRLEMDGVLKSWAVTRGPSLDPEDKRLAVHVEDHPLAYGDFEGTIPAGEYGGGTVLLWDRGEWEPLGEPARGYAKGHLEFRLHGEKLSGLWHLVRMQRRPREKRENWLLIKSDDEDARPGDQGRFLAEHPLSVKSGRDLPEIAHDAPGWSSKTGPLSPKAARDPRGHKTNSKSGNTTAPPKENAIGSGKRFVLPRTARPADLPDFIEPQLATLSARPPTDDTYLHEIKFDGYRLLARIDGGKVTLLTRRGLDWTDRFGSAVAEALRALPHQPLMIDGELVVEKEAGISDFSALQSDLSEGRKDRFRFYAFDLLFAKGRDLGRVPLVRRKALLAALIPDQGPALRFSAHFDEPGDAVLAHACRLGLEGIVSKRRDEPHRPGRSDAWIKSKCTARQEFVIGGYVPSSVSRRAIGALLLGYFDKGRLVHVGKVGTGFTRQMAEDLLRRLQPLRVEASPFSEKLTATEARGARFVRPEMIAEVEFGAWTADGHLRHASFRGLREDKSAAEVSREGGPMEGDDGMTNKPATTIPASLKGLTHPDRIYWPDAGVTKQGLAEYFLDMWNHMAPFVADRPLALLRCPEGIHGERFFQKHAWRGMRPAIRTLHDPEDPEGETLLSITSEKGILALAQSAALEIHPWGSTIRAIDKPDMLTLDLDPGEETGWQDVLDGALRVRVLLEQAGLAAFVKTSGGKGLHVVAPLRPADGWDAVKAFSKAIAEQMAREEPDRYVATITKAKRTGRIFIDYLRNQRGMTAVAPYSPRARPGAPVSMPLAWEELSPAIGPRHFTIANARARMDALKEDPWGTFWKQARKLPD